MSPASAEGAVIVSIPKPDRFAIHKLIDSAERDISQAAKANKDIRQANVLIAHYLEHRPEDIGTSWADAWNRGPGWRKRLEGGVNRLRKVNAAAATALEGWMSN